MHHNGTPTSVTTSRWHFFVILAILLSLTGLVSGCGDDNSAEEPTRFRITIENTSPDNILMTSDGSEHAVLLSPGVWLLHNEEINFLTDGSPLPYPELESLAEEGDPAPLLDVLENESIESGSIGNNENATYETGPIKPGKSAVAIVEAVDGQRLSLAMMFAESNDTMVATRSGGVPLFPDGQPFNGEITSSLALYDAGTELNEEPGLGPNQAARQESAGDGVDQDDPVTRVENIGPQGFTYPAPNNFVKVTIEVL